MNTIPFVMSRDILTVFPGMVSISVAPNHPHYEKLCSLIHNNNLSDDMEVARLANFKEAIQQKVQTEIPSGVVTIGIDAILYDSKPVHSYLTNLMLKMLEQGIDVNPWARFLEKLMRNPSRTAVQELYLWLEKANMPITSEGNFLAYKKVRADMRSFHASPDGSHLIHEIGKRVEMPRNEVDDNRDVTCSTGLHFCSWSYLPSYHGNSGKVLILEIDPADVVSIPKDHNDAKGRCTGYVPKAVIPEKDCQFAFQDQVIALDFGGDDLDEYVFGFN